MVLPTTHLASHKFASLLGKLCASWCMLVAVLLMFSSNVWAEIRNIPLALVIERSDTVSASEWLNKQPEDLAIAGAQLAIKDSNTTGRFLAQHFSLEVFESADQQTLLKQVESWELKNKGIIVVVSTNTLLHNLLSQSNKARVLINAGNKDDQWRREQCQFGLLHTIPSQAMLSDALAQYLVVRRWQKWLLVSSQDPADLSLEKAYQRAAKRFGSKIIARREWSFSTDLRRVAQQEVPALTQAKNYDVVLVTDANDHYGFYLPYNTWLPRPVVGTSGLTPVAWHHSIEQWGAIQLQNRFRDFSQRNMQNEDYAAWLAIRAVAEAVTRTQSSDPKALYQYMLSEQFELAAFKGRKLSFRQFNGQLRQPIPLVQPDALVSQSPQEGFLHPLTELDTLGYDKAEVKCNMDKV